MNRERALLLGGYAIAVPLLFRFNHIVRRRNRAMLAALELGQAMIAAGWVMRRKPIPAVVNSAAVVFYPAWYARKGRAAQPAKDASAAS